MRCPVTCCHPGRGSACCAYGPCCCSRPPPTCSGAATRDPPGKRLKLAAPAPEGVPYHSPEPGLCPHALGILRHVYLIVAEADNGKALPVGDGCLSSTTTRMISRSVNGRSRVAAGEKAA